MFLLGSVWPHGYRRKSLSRRERKPWNFFDVTLLAVAAFLTGYAAGPYVQPYVDAVSNKATSFLRVSYISPFVWEGDRSPIGVGCPEGMPPLQQVAMCPKPQFAET